MKYFVGLGASSMLTIRQSSEVSHPQTQKTLRVGSAPDPYRRARLRCTQAMPI